MHKSVCLRACIENLVVDSSGAYVDATFGRGGHSAAILSKLAVDAKLIAFDCDPEAANAASAMESKDSRFNFIRTNFINIPQELEKEGLIGSLNGIIFDLGVSSPQLDTPGRGFSFRYDGPLDMRMDPSQGWPASAWLEHASEYEISSIIYKFGEEKFARVIAKAIVAARKEQKITTTMQLTELILKTVPRYEQGKHPATRTFQAIRILVNNELERLEKILADSVELLAVKGRLVVLSYHSLEHKAVKNLFKLYGPGNQAPESLKCGSKTVRLKRIGRALRPGLDEVIDNRRARSAYLRVFEKVA